MSLRLTNLSHEHDVKQTAYGIRDYPLDKLEELEDDLRKLAIGLVTTAPVNQFLELS